MNYPIFATCCYAVASGAAIGMAAAIGFAGRLIEIGGRIWRRR